MFVFRNIHTHEEWGARDFTTSSGGFPNISSYHHLQSCVNVLLPVFSLSSAFLTFSFSLGSIFVSFYAPSFLHILFFLSVYWNFSFLLAFFFLPSLCVSLWRSTQSFTSRSALFVLSHYSSLHWVKCFSSAESFRLLRINTVYERGSLALHATFQWDVD